MSGSISRGSQERFPPPESRLEIDNGHEKKRPVDDLSDQIWQEAGRWMQANWDSRDDELWPGSKRARKPFTPKASDKSAAMLTSPQKQGGLVANIAMWLPFKSRNTLSQVCELFRNTTVENQKLSDQIWQEAGEWIRTNGRFFGMWDPRSTDTNRALVRELISWRFWPNRCKKLYNEDRLTPSLFQRIGEKVILKKMYQFSVPDLPPDADDGNPGDYEKLFCKFVSDRVEEFSEETSLVCSTEETGHDNVYGVSRYIGPNYVPANLFLDMAPDWLAKYSDWPEIPFSKAVHVFFAICDRWSIYDGLHKNFSQLTNLRAVRLSNFGFSKIPQVLFSLGGRLEVLQLTTNKIKSLPPDFARFTNLRFLDLHDNELESLDNLPSPLSKLMHLDVARNKLKSLPEIVIDVRKLRYLGIKDNPLEGSLPHWITEFVCQRGFFPVPDEEIDEIVGEIIPSSLIQLEGVDYEFDDTSWGSTDICKRMQLWWNSDDQ